MHSTHGVRQLLDTKRRGTPAKAHVPVDASMILSEAIVLLTAMVLLLDN
jgi:hypothetical protein